MKTFVRRENIGLILYSSIKGNYFLANEKGEELISRILSQKKTSKLLAEEKKIAKEFGLNSYVKVLEHKTQSERKIFSPLRGYFSYTNVSKKGTGLTMSKRMILKILNEMAQLGIMQVFLPINSFFVSLDDVGNYIRSAKSRSISVFPRINAECLCNKIGKLFLNFQVPSVIVYVNNLDWKIRFFEKNESLNNIKNFILLKKRRKLLTKVCLETDLYDNDSFLEETIKFSLKSGIDKLRFLDPAKNKSALTYGIMQDKKILEKTTKKLLNLKKKYASKLAIEFSGYSKIGCSEAKIKGVIGCIGGEEILNINPDGTFTPCPSSNFILGNYYIFKNLSNFFKTQVLDDYIENKRGYLCYSCSSSAICRGECHVYKPNKFGNFSCNFLKEEKNKIYFNPEEKFFTQINLS